MAVKYTIPFKAHDNIQWRVDISNDQYTGGQINVRGVSERSTTLERDGDTDDPFSVFIKGTLSLSIYNQGQIDVNELQQAQDRDFKVSLYREDILKWVGFLVPDGISMPFLSTPYNVEIKAICGLTMLENLPYVHNDLQGTTGDISRCPINYIRNILFTNLGISLPIRWTNNLECTAFPDEDVLTTIQWATTGEGFYSYQSGQNGDDPGPSQSCAYVLEGILKSMQCRIFQENGMWMIRRVTDTVTGNLIYKQVAANLGMLIVQTGKEKITKSIGGTYGFVEEDQVLTVKQGIKTCKVTYNANVRENILPNGNQDIIYDRIFNLKPKIWGGYPGTEPISINSVASIDGREGYSTEIDALSSDQRYFTMTSEGGTLYADGLPIDTKTQIRRINFGFIFSPTGFPIIPGPDEVIDWTDKPLQLQIILNLFNDRYYLNDYGYWQSDPAAITIVVDNMRLHDVAQVNFDKFQGIIMPEPSSNPIAGDTSNIQVAFIAKLGYKYQLDNIKITVNTGNDVYESTLDTSKNTTLDERELTISSSYSGYMISNFMSDAFSSDEECYFNDGLLYSGTLTGLAANAIMRYRYKSSRIFNGSIITKGKNYSFDEIYTIATLGASKFLPLNSSYNIEKCEVSLVAMECRNDLLILTEKYYSSNDQTLSN